MRGCRTYLNHNSELISSSNAAKGVKISSINQARHDALSDATQLIEYFKVLKSIND